MAKTYEFVIVANTSDVKNKLADLDKSLAKMKADLANTSGEGFEKLTQEIAETEEAIKKLTDAEKKFSDQVEKDTPKNAGRFEKFNEGLIKVGDTIGKIGGGVAAAFSIATGAIGAFGDSLGFSQEEMAEAQQKATSYIAILTGIKPLFEGIVSGIGLIKTAFTVLSAVIAANPIGAIITAIGLAIAAVVYWFDEIKAAGVAAAEFIADNWEVVATVIFPIPGLIASAVSYFTDAGDASENITDIALETVNAIKEQAKESAKTAGSMTGDFNKIYDARRKTLDKEREALDKKYLFERSKAIANGEDYKKLDKEYLESKLKTIQQELALQNLRFQQVQKLRVEEEGFFDIEAIKNQERKKEAEERLQTIQDEFLQVQSSLQSITDSEVQAQENAYNAYVERKGTQLEIDRQIEDARLATLEEGQDKEIALLVTATDRKLEDLEAAGKLTEELRLAIENETNFKIKAIEDKYNTEKVKRAAAIEKQAADAAKSARENVLSELEIANEEIFQNGLSEDERQIIAVQDKYFRLIELAKQYGEDTTLLEEEQAKQIAKIKQDAADKEKEEEAKHQRELVDQKLSLTSSGLNLISDLNAIFAKDSEAAARKSFNLNKAVGIAQAAIQTYQSAQGAYLSQLSVPSPDAPIRAAIAAGIATAAGVANIIKISKTQFQGSTPSTSVSQSGLSNSNSSIEPAVPSFNLFGQANQGSQQTQATSVEAGNQQPQVLRAVVSETDIRETNNRLAHIRSNSEL